MISLIPPQPHVFICKKTVSAPTYGIIQYQQSNREEPSIAVYHKSILNELSLLPNLLVILKRLRDSCVQYFCCLILHWIIRLKRALSGAKYGVALLNVA